jgi:hypothetical protein
VPLGELLDSEPSPTVVVRAGDGARVDGTSVHARLLHRLTAPGSAEIYELAIDPRLQSSEAHLPGVRECLVVTRGAVRAGPAAAPADLGPGDSIHYDAAQPHVYQGLERENKALLLMLYPR